MSASHKQHRPPKSFSALKAVFLVEIDGIVKAADVTHPDLPKRMRPAIAVSAYLKENLAPHINIGEARLEYRFELPDLRNKGYFLVEPCILYVFFRAWLRKRGINPSSFD